MLDPPERLRRSERVERTLKVEPGPATEARCRLGKLRRKAPPDHVWPLGLAPTSHFKVINDWGPPSVTADVETAGNGRNLKCAATLASVGVDTTTVLVVDDDPALRLLCRVNLELEGYAVVEAGSIGEAEAALDDGGVDVVLLDLHLGNESGHALVSKIEERGLASSLALLTGSPGSQLPPTATVIPKPFALDDLTGTVRRLAAP